MQIPSPILLIPVGSAVIAFLLKYFTKSSYLACLVSSVTYFVFFYVTEFIVPPRLEGGASMWPIAIIVGYLLSLFGTFLGLFGLYLYGKFRH